MAKDKEIEDKEKDLPDQEEEKEEDGVEGEDESDDEDSKSSRKERDDDGEDDDDDSDDEDSRPQKKLRRRADMTEDERRQYNRQIRERRKQGKINQYRENARLLNEIAQMKQRYAEMERKLTEREKTDYHSEMNRLESAYAIAENAVKEATSNGDGEALARALNSRDQIRDRYRVVAEKVNAEPAPRERQESAQTPQYDDQTKYLVNRWAVRSRFKEWDPSEQMVAKFIDKQLVAEGYDSRSEEYYEELDYRLQDELPHRYKNSLSSTKSSGKAKARPIVAGAGREAPSKEEDQLRRLPKSFLENAEKAGLNVADPAVRKRLLERREEERKKYDRKA